MKCMFIGGILTILSIITLFTPFSTYLKNATEEMMWAGAVGCIIGILLGILIFVIGVRKKLEGKQKNE